MGLSIKLTQKWSDAKKSMVGNMMNVKNAYKSMKKIMF